MNQAIVMPLILFPYRICITCTVAFVKLITIVKTLHLFMIDYINRVDQYKWRNADYNMRQGGANNKNRDINVRLVQISEADLK